MTRCRCHRRILGPGGDTGKHARSKVKEKPGKLHKHDMKHDMKHDAKDT